MSMPRKKSLKECYEILGICRDASKDEIKIAYRKKAKLFHPDLNKKDPHASKKFLEVKDAYDTISDYKEGKRLSPFTYGGRYSEAADFRDTEFVNIEEYLNQLIRDLKRRRRYSSPDFFDSGFDFGFGFAKRRVRDIFDQMEQMERDFKNMVKRFFRGFF